MITIDIYENIQKDHHCNMFTTNTSTINKYGAPPTRTKAWRYLHNHNVMMHILYAKMHDSAYIISTRIEAQTVRTSITYNIIIGT